MSDDSLLYFDHHVTDRESGMRVDVTLCNADDDEVLINIRPATARGAHISFFLSFEAAAGLGTALLRASRPDESYMEEVTRAALDHRGQP